ncbi:hypothetical protein U27_02691 [Candidatus Vecturithrix granuli]|uniref:Uncharacterized protein n=1 Tax=Vecturithrix granuli TaxID=1499967 RepID=A0A081BTS8_VECG1|nr:hypothetical protein U27_02691 [Candidatus Vecturithrix granuli]
MWRQLYHLFTVHEGVYILYLVPITYCMIIVFHVIATKRLLPKQFGIKDIFTVMILLALVADFVNYLYLFSTKTGQLLPINALFVKYTLGWFLWLWVAWYSYEGYFTRRAAGERLRKRRVTLMWVCAATLVLGLVGGILS